MRRPRVRALVLGVTAMLWAAGAARGHVDAARPRLAQLLEERPGRFEARSARLILAALDETK